MLIISSALDNIIFLINMSVAVVYNNSPQYLFSVLYDKEFEEVLNETTNKNVCVATTAKLIINHKYKKDLEINIEELAKYLEENNMSGKKILKYTREDLKTIFMDKPFYGWRLYVEMIHYLLKC